MVYNTSKPERLFESLKNSFYQMPQKRLLGFRLLLPKNKQKSFSINYFFNAQKPQLQIDGLKSCRTFKSLTSYNPKLFNVQGKKKWKPWDKKLNFCLSADLKRCGRILLVKKNEHLLILCPINGDFWTDTPRLY